MHVDVVDGEALAGRNVKPALDPVHLHRAVDVAALAERFPFHAAAVAVFALLKVLHVRVPLALAVRIDNFLAGVAASTEWQMGVRNRTRECSTEVASQATYWEAFLAAP